ncbi:major facilitator superfamily protein [Abortiporus biennis]
MERLRPKKYTARYPRWMVGKPLLYASSALASLGDGMFGYSQGVIAAIQVQPPFIHRFFGKTVTLDQIKANDTGVDPFVQAITVACLNITALIAAFAAAYICDILGRRMSVRIGATIYFIAALIQIFANNLGALIAGRSIQGLGVGMLSMTVPIFQCEIAPGHSRGLFICIEYICLNLGYTLSAWVGYAFFFTLPSELSWRGPYVIQAALALVLVLWTFILPETPRWLIKNGFKQEGLGALADLHGGGNLDNPEIVETFKQIVAATDFEEKMGHASWGQLFTQYTRRAIMGITCQVFAQFNGINAILYFLPANLSRAGFSIQQSLLYAGIAAILYSAGTVPSMFLLDRWGRRAFLITGSFAMAACLAVVGGVEFHADGLPPGPLRLSSSNAIFAFVCLYLFIYGASWGPVPWLLGAEIFPLRARGKGMALSTMSNWISNFIIAFITPPLFSSIGPGYYFLLLGFCVVSGIFVYFVYPETAHLTLEELGSAFGDKVQNEGPIVKKSLEVPNGLGSGGDSISDASTLRPSVGGDSLRPADINGDKKSTISV